MDKTQIINVAYDRVKFIATIFSMSSICSYDHDIMQLTNTGGLPFVFQTSQRNWVIIKVLYKYLRGCMLSWHGSRLGFVTPYDGEVSQSPLGNTTSQTNFANNVTKELATWSCITEWVKRLAGNEIELGMEISTIESQATNILIDKVNYIHD